MSEQAVHQSERCRCGIVGKDSGRREYGELHRRRCRPWRGRVPSFLRAAPRFDGRRGSCCERRWRSTVLYGDVLVRHFAPFLLLAASGCAAVGSYDFDGYHVAPSTTDTADASRNDGSSGSDTSSGDEVPGEGGAAECIPRTCSELHAECGKIPDGCDGQLDCGQCEVGVCGGGGRNKCGDDPCLPRECTELGASCGEI